ncbi:MAG: hydrolase [Jatrophihabitantaceae bacterium]|nr:hydrolase [Jatrophihabitantaceae bacterium]
MTSELTLPGWLQPLADAAPAITTAQLTDFVPPPERVWRPSAVLACFGETDGEADIILVQRPSTMRNHAGQVAFPGGATDPEDDGPVATALREANEEVDLDPASVTVFGQLPGLWLRASGFIAVPVLAWWHTPHALVAEEAECEAVARMPLRALVDPANRWMVRHESGYQGPAFDLADPLDPDRRWFVWGFTANVISQLLVFGGWAQEWDQSRSRPLPG